ncbi:hypothetical protein C8N35_102401 [Breoghania corrubedonensis]|uniref:Uncharacterized protein n=1 Tax=Breoghania corrubedonensis TaxID=665038 RepID=A0A2T5VD74_9HYPH|nr:hypothetical protein [Breoghania corrubedonensis]PTW61686.1 hypothetical protein C8N35_102401 [Breoghania corrubedonensis]
MKRAESHYVMAMSARRSLSKVLFEPANVANAIHEAASLGYRYYRIVQGYPFDLSGTDSAKALEQWLDQEQFRYIWRPAYLEQDPFRPSIVTEYPELVIMW